MGKKDKKDKKQQKDSDVESGLEDLPEVSYFQLYKYSDKWDWLMIFFGALSALAHGGLTPAFVVFFGDIIDDFGAAFDPATLVDTVSDTALLIVYLACGAAVTSYFQVSMFTLTAQRQALRIRREYFRALFRQEIAWYDTQKSGALSTRFSSDVPQIQEALADKVGSFLQFFGMFVAGMIVGFVYGWKLALVILAISPLMGIGGAIMGKVISEVATGGQGFYAEAGHIADEVIRMIKTVIAFQTQDKEVERYRLQLDKARVAGERGGRAMGLGMGFVFFVMFASYAVAFWYGSSLVSKGEMTAGDVIITFFSVIIAAMSLGQASPALEAFAKGRGAAAKIFSVIDREPVIDSLAETGATPAKVEGSIEFKDVTFTYPSRPEDQILRGLTFSVKPRETVALVGASGCGKSTTFALLERFYNPTGGSVSLDGVEIRDLNIQWLRKSISMVEQQPVLFPTSIRENIALGKDNATQEEIEHAAKLANAHDFIMAFPDKYDTMVGDSGTQMSGGQRQRIAIARALVSSPQILLLDEATSALDNESEKIVQAALDRASVDRTTLLIAHRLSTVFQADKIVVVREGVVLEQGSPQELLDQQGAFYDMVIAQQGPEMKGKALSIDAAIKLAEEVQGRLDEIQQSSGAEDKEKMSKSTDSKDAKEEVPEVDRSMWGWALDLNKPELWQMIVGCIAAALEGIVWPVYALILSELLGVLNSTNDKSTVSKYAGAFLGVAAIAFFMLLAKVWLLSIAGERLTLRLRDMVFRAMIKQKAEWYDEPEHSRGILTARLSADAYAVRGMVGDRLGSLCTIVSTVVGSIVIAFYFCWRVGAVILGAAPLMAVGGALQMRLMTGFSTGKAYEKSGKFASEAVEHVRTVAALGRLDSFVNEYFHTLDYPTKVTRRTAQVQGLTFGLTEFFVFAIWSLAFWYGSKTVENGWCDFTDMFKSQMAIVFMGIIVGQNSSMAPDHTKARQAAARLYKLIKDTEDAENEAKKIDYKRPALTGHVEVRDVYFEYKTRKDAPVFTGLNITADPGHTVALVGASGCGKSTTISLIEQYYFPSQGQILFDGVDGREIDPVHLRKHIALVTQQPELFGMSIRENIAYGLDREVSMAEIEEAAKKANAYDFIMQFDDKFETLVGEKGTQLSGGQRQRIAVARALIRADDIKLLLLDEASAALDTESERLVHEALDRAREGRTTIVVAHRLSTIRHADKICVIDGGKVVEEGSHVELMRLKRHYYNLVSSQQFVSEEGESAAVEDFEDDSIPYVPADTEGDVSIVLV
eukprot:m.143059 g.143059  ORF g.143059 m.143059 type:complete len:1275 (+) comp14078_c0_seq2:641-4465(+)